MELTLINNEVQNLNDALDELLLLDDPDSASIPILIGSIFVHYDQVSQIPSRRIPPDNGLGIRHL